MSEKILCSMFEMGDVLSDLPSRIVYAKDFKNQGDTAIQAAVDACANAGGGTIFISAGDWETKPIHLKSRIHLYVEEGANIWFSKKFCEYLPPVFTRWEGMECYNYSPLIYARDCTDIAVTGGGTLFGNGQVWWHWKGLQQSAATELCYAQSRGIDVEKRRYGTEEAALRPSFIQPVGCKNVLIEGITIKDGPQWTIHPVYCENVAVRNVTVETSGPNTDGMNPDSCKNVLIEGCVFNTGDDCIAINSGMNEDGWRVNRPCENVEIRNCEMKGGHGGIAIGSGLSGGVKKIYAHDCKMKDTMQGIRLKSMRGRGGYVEDVAFERISVQDVTDQAIQITMFYEYTTVEPVTSTPSDFRNIRIKEVSGTSKGCGIQIKGLPEHKLKNIDLEQIDLVAEEAFICSDVEEMTWNQVSIRKAEKK